MSEAMQSSPEPSGGRSRYVSPGFALRKLMERGPLTCLQLAAQRALVHLLRRSSVRYVHFNVDALGHLGTEPDCYLKEGVLGWRPRQTPIVLVPRTWRVANEHLLSYWAEHFHIVRPYWLCWLLYRVLQDPSLRYDIDQYMASRQFSEGDETPEALYDTLGYVRIQNEWLKREPLLKLRPQDVEWGREKLRQLGMPDGAWYVCFHVREPGYHAQWDTHGLQQKIQDYRNADVETYLPAMKRVAELGGWSIRVGDPSMKPLPSLPNVIDYAHSDVRSDRMDVFLFGSCRAFVGAASGPVNVAAAFGTVTALTNVCPMAVLPYDPRGISVPKLLWSAEEQRYFTFREVLGSDLANLVNTAQYRERGAEIHDCLADDLLEATEELLEIADGNPRYTAWDEAAQAEFKSLLRPGHSAYGTVSRCARGFLRRHADLLSDASSPLSGSAAVPEPVA